MMARIIREAEGSPFYAPASSYPGDAVTVPEAIARAACAVAQEVKAAPSDIHLGAQATEREVRREIASPYLPAL